MAERRGEPDDHRRPVDGVGERPADPLGDQQDDRLGQDQGHAVAEGVGRGQQPELVGVLGGLDPPGVDGGVLGRRADRGDRRCEHEPAEAEHRVDQGHAEQPGGDDHLADDHPAAPASQTADQRRLDAVDDRAPDELDRVGEAHRRDQADQRDADLALVQPEPQRVADQRKRQAGGEPQRQHERHARAAELAQNVQKPIAARRIEGGGGRFEGFLAHGTSDRPAETPNSSA